MAMHSTEALALGVLLLALGANFRCAAGQANVLGNAAGMEKELGGQMGDAGIAMQVDGSGKPAGSLGSSLAPPTVCAQMPQQPIPYGPCIDPAYPLKGPASDWNSLKWVAPPAPCLVRGMPIEDLEPGFNFRRGYTLGFTDNVEDKSHLLPYLRGSRDLQLSTGTRRVLIDLGSNKFQTSTLWFLQMYPLSFTEVYAFEKLPGRFIIPKDPPSPPEDFREDLTYDSRSQRANPLTRGELQRAARIQLIEAFVDTKDGNDGGVLNITRFLLDELKLTPCDTVIVKMDVEGAEWKILPVWMQVPHMSSIIDEIFVEIHYQDPSMRRFGWGNFPKSRDDAVNLLEGLRRKGFFIHPWP